MRRIINGYQEKIDQTSIIYLTDFSRILKNISWIHLNISQISVDSGQREKKIEKFLKTAMFLRNLKAGYQRYQPDIRAICTPDELLPLG